MTMVNFICPKEHSMRMPYDNNNKIPKCIFTFCHECKTQEEGSIVEDNVPVMMLRDAISVIEDDREVI